MKYTLPKIRSFDGTKAEKETIALISHELQKVKPPHYKGLGILICTDHIGYSTFSGLIILDIWKHYVSMKNWTKDIYPMMMVAWIVHEELHKTQEQKGMDTLVERVASGKLKNNFTDFTEYGDKYSVYSNIAQHYYVCLFTHLWMVKQYGDAYTSVIDTIWQPYAIFERYVRNHTDELLKVMSEVHIAPPDIDRYL